MSAVGLFAMGAVVTLIVCAALGLLVYGAILDSRDEKERKAAEAVRRAPGVIVGHRPAA
jgi:hypothetical protein